MADPDRVLNHTEYIVALHLELSRCSFGSQDVSIAEHEYISGAPSVLVYRWIGDILATVTDLLRHASDHFPITTEQSPLECKTLRMLKWQSSASPDTITALSVLLCVIILIAISGLITVCMKLRIKKHISPTSAKKHIKLDEHQGVTDACSCITDDTRDNSSDQACTANELKPMRMNFPITENLHIGSSQFINDTSSITYFLQKTVSLFFAEIDRLIIQPVSQECSLDLAGSVPRHPRRTSLRRVRVSSPCLSANLSDEANSGEGKVDREQWREVDRMMRKMAWKRQSQYPNINSNDPSVQLVYDYYRKHCFIQPDQWDAVSLVVNYVLVLLEKSLSRCVGVHGVRFVEFISCGSAKTGLKTNKANQFDVHMCLTYLQLSEIDILYNALCSDVPPGKLLLCVGKKQECETGAITTKMYVGGNELCCLSHNQFLLAAHELIDNSIQKLYSKYRSLMDRLHFRIEKSHTTRLIVSIDTRNMIGIGLNNIKIQVIPAAHCPVAGTFGPCSLYAVPPWLHRDHKRRASNEDTRAMQHNPAVWSISCLEIKDFYLSVINRQMQLAGVAGCHEMCIKILKSMFGAASSSSLIDRGELSSHQIETVVSYMLLESSPKQWMPSSLPERLSDCCHFLKKAVTSCRLPDFFIHNPHLLRQMPWLDLLPIVSRGRQENLFMDMNTEVSEKVSSFLEHQLRVSELEPCIREYTDTMWEYEFFIFS